MDLPQHMQKNIKCFFPFLNIEKECLFRCFFLRGMCDVRNYTVSLFLKLVDFYITS